MEWLGSKRPSLPLIFLLWSFESWLALRPSQHLELYWTVEEDSLLTGPFCTFNCSVLEPPKGYRTVALPLLFRFEGIRRYP